MTYDWNKQVEITVPTGTNGWIYSGEVIINGVKVRFPVGVATTVPEPAAALLNKMIELEREDENNTAKPDNHYVGSVTIPEGKTLTLAKGAKVVDEDGVLGGSSTPAPVVILPETELTLSDSIHLTTPWNVEPVGGGVYRVTFCGVEYECKGVGAAEDGMTAVLIGNIPAGLGLTGGNPDMPVMLVCYSNAFGAETGMYCEVQVVDTEWAESWGGTAPALTLSIVQTEGASADSGSGGGVTPLIVNIVMPDMVIDKPYSTVLDALNDGIPVQFRASNENFTNVFHLCEFGVRRIALVLCNFDVNKEWAGYVITPDGKIAMA